MEKFFQDITSPETLIGVIIIGLIVNLAASYIKPYLDKALTLVSDSWKYRAEQRKAQWLKEVDELRGNLENQMAAGFQEMRHRNRSIAYLVMASLFMLMNAVEFTEEHQVSERGITSLMFLINGILSSASFIRASKIAAKLFAARNKD